MTRILPPPGARAGVHCDRSAAVLAVVAAREALEAVLLELLDSYSAPILLAT
jgi:hypothetical protein